MTDKRYTHMQLRYYVLQCDHRSFVVLLLTNMCQCFPQPYGHLSLYAIIDYYLDNLWVFIVEPPRLHDVKKLIVLIAPVS